MSAAVDFGITQVVDGNWAFTPLPKRMSLPNANGVHEISYDPAGPKPVAPSSYAVEANGFVSVPGQMPDARTHPGLLPEGIVAQTRTDADNLRIVLGGLEDVNSSHAVQAR